LNKYERNAVEVTLDYFIDNMYDIRSYFEKPITFETIVSLGEWTLNLIKEHLEGDIEGLKETIEDNWDDKEEKESFEELLEWTNGALQEINKAIEYRKNLGPDGLPLKHLESGIYLNGKRLTDEG
tara:strand:+ start:2616 stop:2990 length:375 start_codon:yes stop_codon:yes gene_type:complete